MFFRRLAVCAALIGAAAPAVAEDTGPNGLQQFMLYRSFVQDAPDCEISVVDGKASVSGVNMRAGATMCPDAYAWADLTNAITASFWDWGIDQTVWPSEPWPMCTTSGQSNCCDATAATQSGDAIQHCPVSREKYSPISNLPAKPNGTPSGGVINHSGMIQSSNDDPGRLLRDLELELVFRNDTMVDHVLQNDLYSREGLGARNRAQNAAIDAGNIIGAHQLQVRFPVGSIMVKADFIHQQIMEDQGLIRPVKGQEYPNNEEFPYLTIYLEGTGTDGEVPGVYYMVAMTNASKELPIWHWYAIEHVANLGRCDYIGCNDSFGYAANGTAQAGANFGASYIPPKIVANDDKVGANDPLFEVGKVYHPADTGEAMTESLQALFAQMGVGTAAVDSDPSIITADDPAWNNYRLKGTQTSFTTPTGVPTGMGATVTEGGFVNSASCTTCHSQAATDKNGTVTTAGVGSTWRPNLMGYNQVVMGSPEASWFYGNGASSSGGLAAITTQVDFIWGILNAACEAPAGSHGVCTAYPDAPRGASE